ncbi:MAG TPA: nucleoside deaminase [Candidatus Saccharimonadales bacterium]|nr:nucleoside deaminase [Candidatus Saccharimonadales bacterium]
MHLTQKQLEELMAVALTLAEDAHNSGDSPFGAVIARQDGKIVVRSKNTTNTDMNPIAHAEMNALTELVHKTRSKKLLNYILVSNIQSCPMCFSALYRSGFRHFVYGSSEDSTLVPKINVHELNKLCTPRAEIITGVLKDQCLQLLARTRNTS